MATFTGQIRQGLPRVEGGEPWPKAGSVAIAASMAPKDSVADPSVAAAQTPVAETPAVAAVTEAPKKAAVAPSTAVATDAVSAETAATPAIQATEAAVTSTAAGVLRRGLPRVPGGEPWPAAGSAPSGKARAAGAAQSSVSAAQSSIPAQTTTTEAAAASITETSQVDATSESDSSSASTAVAASAAVAEGTGAIRRGLARVAGGEPWPAAGNAPAWTVKRVAAPQETVGVSSPETVQSVDAGAAQVAGVAGTADTTKATESTAAESAIAKDAVIAKSEVTSATATNDAATQKTAKTDQKANAPEKLKAQPKPKREPIMIGERTLAQLVKLGSLIAIGAIVAAGIIVLAARGVTTLPGVPEFMQRYPGEYHSAFETEDGFPAWARWSHFLNIFLMVLIIRSGILVRTQQKPPAFWTPKKGGKKISINLWLHTSLDIIWLANGVIFVVLLFVSGHWARIVPTSLEVFPNAASALLQYMTLDWPTENGWVNYNSLQQLMYFIIVFIAAPLAAITGVRMSEWWPEKAERLNKIYPAPLARAIHFPTMIFFVFFILVHVFLVFSTGALRNLNHMFAGTDVVNWTGFWLFALAIALTVGGWFAARPLILAPIANLFGRVSNR